MTNIFHIMSHFTEVLGDSIYDLFISFGHFLKLVILCDLSFNDRKLTSTRISESSLKRS